MFSQFSQFVKDVSVVRRLQFAARFSPKTMPNYWDHITAFSQETKAHRNSLTPENVRLLIENLEVIDQGAFASDKELTKEIVMMAKPGTDAPLGIILISSKESCRKCGARLFTRADRFSSVIVYDDNLGTLPGTHFTKYCRKRGCSLQQHYGFYSQGSSSEVTYDEDWSSLEYFMSTHETAFSLELLRRLDKEILIGQISYKQRADIYNDVHGYHGGTPEEDR